MNMWNNTWLLERPVWTDLEITLGAIIKQKNSRLLWWNDSVSVKQTNKQKTPNGQGSSLYIKVCINIQKGYDGCLLEDRWGRLRGKDH